MRRSKRCGAHLPRRCAKRPWARLREFAAHGTTSLEAKSGYGLDWKSEVKTLALLQQLHQEQPLDIAATFLGAHVVPPEFRRRPGAFVELAR